MNTMTLEQWLNLLLVDKTKIAHGGLRVVDWEGQDDGQYLLVLEDNSEVIVPLETAMEVVEYDPSSFPKSESE